MDFSEDLVKETEDIVEELNDEILPQFKNTLLLLNWKDRFAPTPIPTIVLDKNLSVVWSNNAFNLYFNDLAVEINHTQLTVFFENLKDISQFRTLFSDLHDKKKGFTWKGRVTSKNRRRRSDVANLLITPLDFSEEGFPLSFTGILDMVTDEYREMLRNMFSSLLGASKLKDNDTGNHIERVNQYSRFIAEKLKENGNFPEIDEDFIEDIGFLAAMHDVGKIGTPDDILNKTGPLESWEREVMNEHTKNGAYILSTYPNPMAKQIALHHHEKWDGTGYPFGMANQMIPLCARIVAVADVYDALRMKRSYKEAFSHEKTKEIISNLSGSHFDPILVRCFLDNHDSFNNIFTELIDEKEEHPKVSGLEDRNR